MTKLKLLFEAIHSGVAPRDENNGLKLPTTAEERKNLGRLYHQFFCVAQLFYLIF